MPQLFDMSAPHISAKDKIIRLIEQQPEDSSYDAILRELAFGRMIERGLADADAGRTVPHEEMRRTIESWRK